MLQHWQALYLGQCISANLQPVLTGSDLRGDFEHVALHDDVAW